MKRFLMILTSTVLAALVMFALARGVTSTASAAEASQTETVQLHGPDGPRPNDGTRAGGQVASVSGSTITVSARNGGTQDILTTAATTFTLDGAAADLSAIAAGQFVHAEGSTDDSGAFTATAVRASTTQPEGRPGRGGPRPDDGTRAGGQVASVSGSTITVSARNGGTQDILTTAATTFTLDGAAADLSAIAAGQFVHAEGSTDDSGAFTATAVRASTTQPEGRPGRGPRP